MRLYNVSNMNHVMQALDACQGSVDIITPDGQIYAWHEQNHCMLRTLFSTQGSDLEIRCKNKNDAVRLVRSAMSNWPKESAIA